MRLQKYLADAGVASRRACEALIAAGRVRVNGATAAIGQSVEAGDTVELDGKPVACAQRHVVILFYKPRGVVCTSEDPEGRRTVQDYFRDLPERLYNVGRLDLNSEGLLLMTNDGALAHRLTHPHFGVEKTYYVVCDGKVTASDFAKLTNGVLLDDGMTAPARVDCISTTQRGDTSFLITIHEGRNRQIRRMAEAIGHRTLRLKRERFGCLELGTLKPGEWRYLTESELTSLRALLGL
ncbi:MAG: pseudouridine synthase [bacterium]|nr:pseudouridine synthase [bacterium]